MSKQVAVTGGGGFLGRHLVARHVALGDDVRYLTRSISKPALPGATPYAGDLRTGVGLRNFVSGVDVLYHCAAELHDPSKMKEVNVHGTERLLSVADRRIGMWVQLSSTGVYGPVRSGVVDEECAIAPANPYELSKAAADDLVKSAADTGLNCVILRPSNIYGPGMRNQSLFQLIRMIDRGLFFYIGSDLAMANYIHVSNVVDALILSACCKLRNYGRVYIVSDSCSLVHFVEIIANALGRSAPRCRLPELPVRFLARVAGCLPGFPIRESRVDALTNAVQYCSRRIELELGHRNYISLESGLVELVEAWKHARGN